MLQFLATEEFKTECYSPILDLHKLPDQKNNKEQSLASELGRFFIIN